MTEKKWCLYRHTSPSGKVYVGITSKPILRRWNNGNGYRTCKNFWRAILKYGWDNIIHEVLFDQLSEERAKQLEISIISHYKGLGISYNITNGGDGSLGYCPSKETRAKIAKASTGRTHVCSDETKQKLRQIRLNNSSIYKSQEFKDRMSEALNYKKVRVVQFTLSWEFLKTFNSANEAQIQTGVNRGAILRCCKGKVKRAGNFIWKYYE